jgi:hypothetical protein
MALHRPIRRRGRLSTTLLDTYADIMTIEQNAAAINALYWKHLGRAPTAEVSWLYQELLAAGVSLERIAERMATSPEAELRRQVVAHASWYGGDVGTIPFHVQEGSGAPVMLVRLPGIGLADEPPGIGLVVGDQTRVHHVGLGVSGLIPVTPKELLVWSRHAAELIEEQAATFGVPMSNVVCFGSSYQGCRAMMTGLVAKVGWILVGAPVIRMGTWTQRLRDVSDATVNPVFSYYFERSGIAEDPQQAQALDDLIPGLCFTARETSIHLIVSKQDAFYEDALELRDILRDQPSAAHCDVIEAGYPDHSQVELPLHHHVNRMLTWLGA